MRNFRGGLLFVGIVVLMLLATYSGALLAMVKAMVG